MLRSQIWTEILSRLYPRPKFSRKSVYQYWHNLARKQWTLDVDEVLSAEKLLDEAHESDHFGKYRFDRIELDVPDGFSAIAFSIPEMLARWGTRIREIAIDSACEYRIDINTPICSL